MYFYYFKFYHMLIKKNNNTYKFLKLFSNKTKFSAEYVLYIPLLSVKIILILIIFY